MKQFKVFYYTDKKRRRVELPSNSYRILKRELGLEEFLFFNYLGYVEHMVFHSKYKGVYRILLIKTNHKIKGHLLYETIQT